MAGSICRAPRRSISGFCRCGDLPESLDNARIGGYGIPLLRAFSNGVDYRRDDDRNILTLTFRW
ncbi:MAG TPA: hypothetical protein VL225_18950 [Vicinamibacterales bacterium]|nr:hypothetical protein [Vicinamibacterales bacterium]